LDDRITTSHSIVPGHDGRHGFGGTCFPKDMASLRHQIQTNDLQSFIIDAAIERNETIDRPEKDWTDDIGRASI
jgi:UDPglucose 6-dehydrogenase